MMTLALDDDRDAPIILQATGADTSRCFVEGGLLNYPDDLAQAITAAANALPTLALAATRAAKTAAVNAKRDAIIGGGYQQNFGGTAGIRTLDTRSERDLIHWQSLRDIWKEMIAGGQGAELVEIIDAANDLFTASADTGAAAIHQMGIDYRDIWRHGRALRNDIEIAADETALAAIDIDAGWPAYGTAA